MENSPEITITENAGEVIVKGGGILDLTNAKKFKDGLAQASTTADEVTVDLTSARFIDTAILEYLAKAAKTLLGRGKRLTVLVKEGSHPAVILRRVGFATVMNICEESQD